MTPPENRKKPSNSLETERPSSSVSSTIFESERINNSRDPSGSLLDSPPGEPLLDGYRPNSEVRAEALFPPEFPPIGESFGQVFPQAIPETGNGQKSKIQELRVPCGFLIIGKGVRHVPNGRWTAESLRSLLSPGGRTKLILAKGWPEHVKNLRVAASARVGALPQPSSDSAYSDQSDRRTQIQLALLQGGQVSKG